MAPKKTPHGTWRVRWRDQAERLHVRTFSRYADAVRFDRAHRAHAARRREPPDGVAGVYTALGDADEVLFIGATDDLASTIAEHQTSAWWPDVRRVTWRSRLDLTDARRRAARLILDRQPNRMRSSGGR